MPTFKNYKKFLKIIIFQILNIFLITSCVFKDLNTNNSFNFNSTKNQFKKLIIPEGNKIPDIKKEYNIPYIDKDLEKENCDIFPPI